MADLRFRLWTLFYRLKGHSEVQAAWRARQRLALGAELKAAATAQVERVMDSRFHCVCGQLLLSEDRRCHACGRRQWLPMPLRRAARALGLEHGLPDQSATYFIMALTALGFALQYKMIGASSPSGPYQTLSLGASFGPLTLGPQPWRAFTYTLVHGGWMHFGFNLFALMQIGPLIERWFGASRFLFGWVLGGAMGVFGPLFLAQILPNLMGAESMAPIIGASGAISGLIGMALIRGHLAKTPQGTQIRNVMIRWMLYTTLFGVMVGGAGIRVAHGAHFGGLLGGVLVGWLLAPPGRDPTRRRLTPLIGLLALMGVIAPSARYAQWLGAAMLTDYSERVGVEAALGAAGWTFVQAARVDALASRLDQLPETHRLLALTALAERVEVHDLLTLERVTLSLLEDGRIIPDRSGLLALQRVLDRRRGAPPLSSMMP
ncbi:rhomboid family intramembrane serine protease [Myxococcota bacterium]|nr:rhomboid family intramembrane serine protease [Myxococcota bacterium]